MDWNYGFSQWGRGGGSENRFAVIIWIESKEWVYGLCLRGILGKIVEINFKPNNWQCQKLGLQWFYGLSLWIESMDWVYGLSLWIKTMDLVNGEEGQKIGLQWFYGLSLRSESMDCVYGLSVWIECTDWVYGSSPSIESMDWIYGFSLWGRRGGSEDTRKIILRGL